MARMPARTGPVSASGSVAVHTATVIGAHGMLQEELAREP
jgi:hypothetical protein